MANKLATRPLVLKLKELRREHTADAGGKGANLGELVAIGMSVPPGYVVATHAFRRFLADAGLHDRFIAEVNGVAVDDRRRLQETADRLRELVRNTQATAELKEAILAPYREMGDGNVSVAVRSSATAEDTAAASFAGMNESFLGRRGEDQVWQAIRDCWASLYAPRVIAYRRDLGVDERVLAIAVVVQEMVDATWAGVMLTEHPDGGSGRLIIEAAPGLGEVVVGGRVTPDLFTLDKTTLQVQRMERGHHVQQLVMTAGGVPSVVACSDHEFLPFETVAAIGELGRRIEKHYGVAQDIEWAIDRDGSIRILQARPITAGRVTLRADTKPAVVPTAPGKVLVQGIGSGFGRGCGRPVVLQEYDPEAPFEKGDVLVAPMTAPDWFPIIRKAAAIVTDEGGATSHAAIIARELGIAGVVGTGDATTRLRGVDLVTADGARGVVWEGGVQGPAAAEATPPKVSAPTVTATGITATETTATETTATELTATEILCNLSTPDRAAEVAAGPVDGVGLVRAETMLLSALAGKHPQLLVERGQGDAFVDGMCEALVSLARPFGNRPVVYRTYDFRTNEFRSLEGGERFEPVEANPMIGMRGCARYLRDPTLFLLEVRAIRRAREEHGCTNLAVMLPFVRTAHEIRECAALLRREGVRPEEVRLDAMAEVPSIMDNLAVLKGCGFHGVSIGSNDLVQLLLGVDRDNEQLASVSDARDPAVLAYIERLIHQAKEMGLHTAICGQAPSIYPDFAGLLVEFGIDAISVNPDAVRQVRHSVAVAERRILLRKARHWLGNRP